MVFIGWLVLVLSIFILWMLWVRIRRLATPSEDLVAGFECGGCSDWIRPKVFVAPLGDERGGFFAGVCGLEDFFGECCGLQ